MKRQRAQQNVISGTSPTPREIDSEADTDHLAFDPELTAIFSKPQFSALLQESQQSLSESSLIELATEHLILQRRPNSTITVGVRR
mmetsp:Transcript_9981/g.15067  ORF Transcript_9981/g.15067 Transcript_9981/m.15067 type:complete len:86 (-) Transcript_9981:281-538(-)